MGEHDYRGRLTILPSDLYFSDDVRMVTLPDDDEVRKTWVEIDRRALDSYERSYQEHMSVLGEMGNMPLD
ncbi:hypothetical protein J4423_00620 [Candidatus Pacearchaeota archaeon]|nr:hypothetical protein [Candidatus Pacearchaeota archaeon]